jgi:hypothetical protein
VPWPFNDFPVSDAHKFWKLHKSKDSFSILLTQGCFEWFCLKTSDRVFATENEVQLYKDFRVMFKKIDFK